MSGTENTASPRAPRGAKHQHSRSANPTPSNDTGNKPQRRPKGNRAHNTYNAAPQNNATHVAASQPAKAQDAAFPDSAVVSSEEVAIPAGPRGAKKHTRSQPSGGPVFTPTAIPASSLTDSELGQNNAAATPAKVQAAYAGPTFHASPAPSALPIPKFLSKSVPAKARSGPPTPPPEEGSESSPSPSPSPSPSRAPIPVPPRHEDSPLDMLFRADRAEKARNTNCSPVSASFSSPNQPLVNGRPHHAKQDSYSSLNAPFPIELDGESKSTHPSPPAASPGAHRSVTAPSKIPQVGDSAKPNDDSGAIQDLLNRLSMSQKKPTTSTPPRTVDHMPSDPSLRQHTPPFHDGRSSYRSTSGPTTPAPTSQEAPDFFYGNRNLSPLFKAAKTETNKRNSGLRMEITADSPLMAQGGFPPMPPPTNIDTNAASRAVLGNALNGPVSPRRGSALHVQPLQPIPPYRDMTSNHKARTPGRRSYHPRPDSYPHAKKNAETNGTTSGAPISMPKSSTSSTFSFVPSSVRAKPSSTPPRTSASDPLALEQDLKRMLNLKTNGDTNGVR